jgi:hypothetical protein
MISDIVLLYNNIIRCEIKCLFQRISNKNARNWGQRVSIHCTGSKSFSQISYENVRSNSSNMQTYNANICSVL